MRSFQYTASDVDGKKVSGSVSAEAPGEARRKLSLQGLENVQMWDEMTAVALADSGRVEAATDHESARRPGFGIGGGAEAISRTAELIETGIPLAAGLLALSEEVPKKKLRRSLQEMAGRLEGGEDLETVLTSRSLRLPASLNGLVAAGIRAGNPVSFMTHFLRFARMQLRRRNRIRVSLAYPAALLMLGALIVGALLYFVVPQMQVMFTEFGMELPVLTECVLEISRLTVIAVGWWPFAVPAGVVAILFLPAGLSRLNSMTVWRQCVYRLPLLGSTYRYGALAEYCHLLAILIDCQIPLPEALKLAGDGSADCCLREGSYQLSRQAERGEPLVQTQRPEFFPPDILNAINWNDQKSGNGGLSGETLRYAGDLYIAQTEVNSRLLVLLLEPILIALMAGVMGLLLITLFGPVATLLMHLG